MKCLTKNYFFPTARVLSGLTKHYVAEYCIDSVGVDSRLNESGENVNTELSK